MINYTISYAGPDIGQFSSLLQSRAINHTVLFRAVCDHFPHPISTGNTVPTGLV